MARSTVPSIAIVQIFGQDSEANMALAFGVIADASDAPVTPSPGPTRG